MMEEIQSYSDNYRSSSSSASSPVSRAPSGAFFYLRKPGTVRQPISFEDSPEWEDTDVDARVEEGGDSVHIAPATASPSLSKINSGSLTSPSLPEPSIITRKIAGVSVAWKDLTVTLKGKRKYSDQVIKGSNGYALPGTLTVIMGPAKSGKSTLLRAIAGRLPDPARMYGEVFMNGTNSPLPYGSYGYVNKEDALIEALTVREMLYYSALLQLPGFFSQKKIVVEDAILAMSLGDYSDRLIGGHCYMKSLPRGERRRVSIARELVMRPHILFIDEPLYHLDSVSALLMMVTLKKLASTGCTLIFTMNQSSTEVFGLFDRICLLSNGNTLFFGETLSCLQSPSDHFLRAINTDFDRIIAMCKNLQDDHGDLSSVNMDTAVAIRTLEVTYKSSADAAAVESMIMRLTEKEGPLLKSKGKASSATRVRVAAVFIFVSFTSLFSISGLPAHIREIKIFTHEETNKHSGALVFLLGHLLSSIPFLILISITSSVIFYFLVGMRNEFSLLMYFVLNLFMCLLVNEGLMMLVAYIWLEVFRCMITLVFIHGLLENEYIGTKFPVGQVRSISGVQALQDYAALIAD
ncbi:ABC transporter G family member 3 [Acorus calamus]|uniref:ABC transporter G family member 3 n=1 Tax=Acorus calamus TaxID=4465 RepID=A0AAV9EM41_ACOCL|nr:ABC transporter G family member 3 [Acorus calamus]